MTPAPLGPAGAADRAVQRRMFTARAATSKHGGRRDRRLHQHHHLHAPGQWHRVRRAERDGVRERHVHVVGQSRMPVRLGEFPVLILWKLEVAGRRPWRSPAYRTTPVNLPEQQPERDDVRAPDRQALEQQLRAALLLPAEHRGHPELTSASALAAVITPTSASATVRRWPVCSSRWRGADQESAPNSAASGTTGIDTRPSPAARRAAIRLPGSPSASVNCSAITNRRRQSPRSATRSPSSRAPAAPASRCQPASRARFSGSRRRVRLELPALDGRGRRADRQPSARARAHRGEDAPCGSDRRCAYRCVCE